MAGQQLVKDYSELIKSRTVTSSVINELKLKDITPESLASKITVSSKNNTRIIEIKVQDGDPNNARAIADKVSNVFISKVIEIMNAQNVGIIDKAETPTNPVKPNKRMNVAIAFLIGIMAAVGLIFFLEYVDDTIKTNEDVEKYLGLTVLGTIPVLSLE
jgi:capsular polysaccharide biosynthesis protein